MSDPSEIQEQINSLNNDQREVALCMGHCLAIAAPGSGKTKTLAVKAAYLLDRGHTVTAVTFTRDAAIELRDRIIQLAGQQHLPNLLVGTFHSINLLMAFPGKAKSGMGSSILKAGFSKMRRPWEIVKEGSRRSFVVRAINESGMDLDLGEATSMIEALKSGHKQPENQHEEALHKTYTSLLKKHGVIDFQDILLETNRAISKGEISPLNTDHLMIDEFQDTDVIQFNWAMFHSRASVLTAVGDDDQSIYGFRRALGYDGMKRFQDRLMASRFVLGLNYRSNEEVLKPSALLISRNQNRMDKALVSFKGPGGSAMWERFGSRTVEAQTCHGWVREGLEAGQSVGVLARTNARLNEVETQCIKHETPYVRADGGSILETLEMHVCMATIGLMVRSSLKDVEAVLAWMKLPENEINAILKASARKQIIDFSKDDITKIALSGDSRTKLYALVRRLKEWRVFLQTQGLTFLVDGIEEMLSKYADDKRSVAILEIVLQIFSKPLDGSSAVEAMAQRLVELQEQLEAKRSKDKTSQEGAVYLMTAHGSKGLEWDRVWVLGAEMGTFPDEASSIQEERRLFFVAMTRARQDLIMSAAGSRPLSLFVEETGALRAPEVTMAKYMD